MKVNYELILDYACAFCKLHSVGKFYKILHFTYRTI